MFNSSLILQLLSTLIIWGDNHRRLLASTDIALLFPSSLKGTISSANRILAAFAIAYTSKEPIQDLASSVLSCPGATDFGIFQTHLFPVKIHIPVTTRDVASKQPIPPSPREPPPCVTISRFQGWFRPLLLWDLFLKPEYSNTEHRILSSVIVRSTSASIVLPSSSSNASRCFRTTFLSSFAIEFDSKEPIQDPHFTVQSCPGPKDFLIPETGSISIQASFATTSDTRHRNESNNGIGNYTDYDFFATYILQGYTLVIKCHHFQIPGVVFQSLLLWDLFLKPENSNNHLDTMRCTSTYTNDGIGIDLRLWGAPVARLNYHLDTLGCIDIGTVIDCSPDTIDDGIVCSLDTMGYDCTLNGIGITQARHN